MLNHSLKYWDVQSDLLSSTDSLRGVEIFIHWLFMDLWKEFFAAMTICVWEVASAMEFLAPCTCAGGSVNLKCALRKNKQRRRPHHVLVPCPLCVDCLHHCTVVTKYQLTEPHPLESQIAATMTVGTSPLLQYSYFPSGP